jgi:hypothetical protein
MIAAGSKQGCIMADQPTRSGSAKPAERRAKSREREVPTVYPMQLTDADRTAFGIAVPRAEEKTPATAKRGRKRERVSHQRQRSFSQKTDQQGWAHELAALGVRAPYRNTYALLLEKNKLLHAWLEEQCREKLQEPTNPGQCFDIVYALLEAVINTEIPCQVKRSRTFRDGIKVQLSQHLALEDIAFEELLTTEEKGGHVVVPKKEQAVEICRRFLYLEAINWLLKSTHLTKRFVAQLGIPAAVPENPDAADAKDPLSIIEHRQLRRQFMQRKFVRKNPPLLEGREIWLFLASLRPFGDLAAPLEQTSVAGKKKFQPKMKERTVASSSDQRSDVADIARMARKAEFRKHPLISYFNAFKLLTDQHRRLMSKLIKSTSSVALGLATISKKKVSAVTDAPAVEGGASPPSTTADLYVGTSRDSSEHDAAPGQGTPPSCGFPADASTPSSSDKQNDEPDGPPVETSRSEHSQGEHGTDRDPESPSRSRTSLGDGETGKDKKQFTPSEPASRRSWLHHMFLLLAILFFPVTALLYLMPKLYKAVHNLWYDRKTDKAWVRLFSAMAGGVAGYWGYIALGAALGSVVPGVGTLLGLALATCAVITCSALAVAGSKYGMQRLYVRRYELTQTGIGSYSNPESVVLSTELPQLRRNRTFKPNAELLKNFLARLDEKKKRSYVQRIFANYPACQSKKLQDLSAQKKQFFRTGSMGA